jgi:cysteine synthase B
VRYDDIAQAIGNTPLVGLPNLSPDGYQIYLKLEGHNPTGSVKDRVAKYLIEQAEKNGDIHPGDRILEPTSGNTGISLAALCKVKGYRLTCVMPENTSEERRQLLEMFGADIVYSPATEGSNGSVRVAREMAAADPDVFMPFQYGNPANPMAHYETTAPEIIQDLPDVTAFVAGLGTGGTVTGVGKRLKQYDPSIKIYAAEPEYGDLVYGLRNLDEGYVPEVLDLDVLDSRIKVNSLKALTYAPPRRGGGHLRRSIHGGLAGRRGAGVQAPAGGLQDRCAVARRWLEVPVHRRLCAGRRRRDRRADFGDAVGLGK